MAEETGQQAPASDSSYQRGAGGVAALLRDAMRKPDESAGESSHGDDESAGESPPVDTANAGGGSGEPNQERAPQEITDDQDETDGDQGGDTDEIIPAPSFSELAKAAGVSIQELYEVEIPLGDERGNTTLGQLKDRFRDLQRVDQVRETMEDQRTEFENSMIRARGELNEIIGLLPNVPTELLERARAEHRATRDTEREMLLTVKPEWKDDAKFENAQTEIIEAISEYGFKRGDFDLVMDHRLVKLLHDFAGMKRRLGEANAQGKQLRETGRLQTGRRSTARTKQKTRGNLDKLMEDAKGGDKVAQSRAVERLISDAGVTTR